MHQHPDFNASWDDDAIIVRRYVTATPVDPMAFRSAAAASYAAALGRDAEAGTLTDLEARVVEEVDAGFTDDEWLRGPSRRSPSTWRVKVKAGDRSSE